MNMGLATEIIPTTQEAADLLRRLQNLLTTDHLFRGSLANAVSRQQESLPWNFNDEGNDIIRQLLLFSGKRLGTLPTPMTMQRFIGEIEEMLA